MSTASASGVPFRDLAARVERAVWFERTGFEVVGGWVADESDAASRLAFARHSHHHAWRADVLAALRPRASGFDPPPAPLPTAWVEVMAALRELTDTETRVAGYYGAVLPGAIRGYERWDAETHPVTDQPVRRSLARALHDVRLDHSEGVELLARLRMSADRESALAVAVAAAGEPF